jgi:superfamily I DNA/RNA helicase
MYAVYEKYRELRASEYGRQYDWDDLAGATRRTFEDDEGERMYRHVVIDEGQDFSPSRAEG